jgi:hypothetical protein
MLFRQPLNLKIRQKRGKSEKLLADFTGFSASSLKLISVADVQHTK